MYTTSGGYLFECNIDEFSESEVVDLIHSINYSIDNMIMNLLAVTQSAGQQRISRNPSYLISDDPLLSYLKDFWLTGGNAAKFAAEFILRNLIYTNIYSHFFAGQHFLGVGSESLQTIMDRIMTEIKATSNVLILVLYLFNLTVLLFIPIAFAFRQVRQCYDPTLAHDDDGGNFQIE